MHSASATNILVNIVGNYTVSVTDVRGRALWRGHADKPAAFTVDRAVIASGVKVVKLESAGTVVVQRVLFYY